MISLIALIVAATIPLGFLYAVNKLDFYRTGNIRFIALSGLWGVIAYYLAARINPALVENGVVSRDMLVRFVAPGIEETLKGLILIYLVRQINFKYFVDGAIYGFASGIGFAIFENFEYVLGHPSIALSLSISRVLSTNLIHATSSALIGIALGLARFDHSLLRRAFYMLGGLGLAYIVHSGFNNMVNSGAALLFAFAAGFSGAGIIYLAIQRGLKEEGDWIKEKLGMADGVTSGEASVVHRLNKLDDVLSPLAAKFGDVKAVQSEQFLVMQAQIGIQRKMLEKLKDEKMRLAVEAQMEDLREKMNIARREVGVYCMLYLRNIFPENDNTIQSIIQERIAFSAAANKGEAGSGLWDKLGDRTKRQSAPEKSE
ncbi:MAG: PrsW family intramembrane metalloprotease [Chloroflexi bacterium]|nr:PrsW family intramembrane metalloprotease [Chloroflexota bacterium]